MDNLNLIMLELETHEDHSKKKAAQNDELFNEMEENIKAPSNKLSLREMSDRLIKLQGIVSAIKLEEVSGSDGKKRRNDLINNILNQLVSLHKQIHLMADVTFSNHLQAVPAVSNPNPAKVSLNAATFDKGGEGRALLQLVPRVRAAASEARRLQKGGSGSGQESRGNILLPASPSPPVTGPESLSVSMSVTAWTTQVRAIERIAVAAASSLPFRSSVLIAARLAAVLLPASTASAAAEAAARRLVVSAIEPRLSEICTALSLSLEGDEGEEGVNGNEEAAACLNKFYARISGHAEDQNAQGEARQEGKEEEKEKEEEETAAGEKEAEKNGETEVEAEAEAEVEVEVEEAAEARGQQQHQQPTSFPALIQDPDIGPIGAHAHGQAAGESESHLRLDLLAREGEAAEAEMRKRLSSALVKVRAVDKLLLLPCEGSETGAAKKGMMGQERSFEDDAWFARGRSLFLLLEGGLLHLKEGADADACLASVHGYDTTFLLLAALALASTNQQQQQQQQHQQQHEQQQQNQHHNHKERLLPAARELCLLLVELGLEKGWDLQDQGGEDVDEEEDDGGEGGVGEATFKKGKKRVEVTAKKKKKKQPEQQHDCVEI